MRLLATIVTPDQPPAEFSAIRATLCGEQGENSKKDALRQAFRQRFGARKCGSRLAWDGLEVMRDYLNDNGSELFDHVEIYKDWRGYLLVTQPYAEHDANFVEFRELEAAGCQILDLNAWSWHYPNHAFCYGIRFTRAVIRAMRVIVEARRFAKTSFSFKT